MKNEIFYGDPIALNWKADDGAAATVRVQLSPFGEFELRDGGRRSGTVQRCSRATFEAMVADWKARGAPDVLVDVDHASATGGSTEAARAVKAAAGEREAARAKALSGNAASLSKRDAQAARDFDPRRGDYAYFGDWNRARIRDRTLDDQSAGSARLARSAAHLTDTLQRMIDDDDDRSRRNL